MKRPCRPRSGRPALIAVLLLVANPLPLRAEVALSDATACAPASGDASASVVSVSDDLDVTLRDGRVLRLAGLDPPRATAASPDLPDLTRRALDAWLSAGSVAVHLLSASPDRWGRIPALLFRPRDPTGPGGEADGSADASAAGTLLRGGLARLRPEASSHACLPAFREAEAAARAERRGLWADPHYAVLTAADADGLAAQAGGMALVEGVMHLHEGRGALYLALGRDRWGFVAVVSRRDAARFAKAGLDLHDYDATPVRLRGDLDSRFGPRLRLTEPDAIESLEPGSLSEDPRGPRHTAPKHWTGDARNR